MVASIVQLKGGGMSKLVRFMVVAGLILGATAAGAQSVPDALVADPDVHQVMLDNEHVRVFRALAAHGAKSPMHSHPPLVIVSLRSEERRVGKECRARWWA